MAFLAEKHGTLVDLWPDIDDSKDAHIYNKIDVVKTMEEGGRRPHSVLPNAVWDSLTIAVTKMGYFGHYSRVAMELEETGASTVFTFAQFMHVYPFLREMDTEMSSLDQSEAFCNYVSQKQGLDPDSVESYIMARSLPLQAVGDWKQMKDTPLWTRQMSCSMQGCPAVARFTLDPAHEIVFVTYQTRHWGCAEVHKRKIYDVVRKAFVRFGGDLDYLNGLYVDMPRRYGVGYVESSLQGTSSTPAEDYGGALTMGNGCQIPVAHHVYPQNAIQSHTVMGAMPPSHFVSGLTTILSPADTGTNTKHSWASTLKRRTMYALPSAKLTLPAPTRGPQEDLPEWLVHLSKNARGDLVEIYRQWRQRYFHHQDTMWESLTGTNWKTDYALVKEYWEMARLEGVQFVDSTRSIVVAKEHPLTDSTVWIITEDQSLATSVALPKTMQSVDGVESNASLPGVLAQLRGCLSNYTGALGLFRIVNAETGLVAGFIVCQRGDIWTNLKILAPDANQMKELTVLTSTTIDDGRPPHVRLLSLDYIRGCGQCPALRETFPLDIIRELEYAIMGNSFSRVRTIVKSRLPRQRAHAIDPLHSPMVISSPMDDVMNNAPLLVRVANLTGTARVALRSMLQALDEIEHGVNTPCGVEYQRACVFATERHVQEMRMVSPKHLRVLWMHTQLNGSELAPPGFNGKPIGIPEGLPETGPALRQAGRGTLGLLTSLISWKQQYKQ